MKNEQLNQHYLYITENNNMIKNPFFWRNYDKNDKIHFKNVLRALKTNKNLEFKLKREWMINAEKKRIVYIKFSGIYKKFWSNPGINSAKDFENYHNLFKK
jgi:hypothetical protein